MFSVTGTSIDAPCCTLAVSLVIDAAVCVKRPSTWNSKIEYPYCAPPIVVRAVPVSRTYRPLVPAGAVMLSVAAGAGCRRVHLRPGRGIVRDLEVVRRRERGLPLDREAADVGVRAEVELEPLGIAERR